MPRTFSLAHLLLVISLIAIICGVARTYPDYALLVSLFVPTGIICLILVSFSHHRAVVLLASFVGAFVGFLFAPVAMSPPGDKTTIWPHVQALFLPIACYATLGALLFGGAALADDLLHPPDSRPPTSGT
jgi:hypothetical protein